MSTPTYRMRELRLQQRMAPREDAVLRLYLREIGHHPLLTANEEEGLASRAAAGDARAREQLVVANLRFVVSVAKHYQERGLPLMDLIAEGNIGLMKAAERFDPSRGFKFISYAAWWVRQRILKALTDDGSTVRLPHKAWHLRQRMRKLENSPGLQEGRLLPVAEQARLLDVPVSRLRALALAPLGRWEGLAPDALEQLADATSSSTDSHAEAGSFRSFIFSELGRLTAPQRQVLELHYGLRGGEALLLRSIAPLMGVSPERVRQIREQALARLRASTHFTNELKNAA